MKGIHSIALCLLMLLTVAISPTYATHIERTDQVSLDVSDNLPALILNDFQMEKESVAYIGYDRIGFLKEIQSELAISEIDVVIVYEILEDPYPGLSLIKQLPIEITKYQEVERSSLICKQLTLDEKSACLNNLALMSANASYDFKRRYRNQRKLQNDLASLRTALNYSWLKSNPARVLRC